MFETFDKKQLSFIEYKSPLGDIFRFDNLAQSFVVTFSGTGVAPFNLLGEGRRYGKEFFGLTTSERLIEIESIDDNLNPIAKQLQQDFYYDQFSPYNDLELYQNSGVLTFYRSDGSIRHINVILDNPLEVEADGSEWTTSNKNNFRFITQGEPFFYSPSITEILEIERERDNLVFPTTFGTGYGLEFLPTSKIIYNVEVDYKGNIFTLPTFQLTNQFEYIEIINRSNNKVIKLTHSSINGESVVINLSPNNKSIISDKVGNITHKLSSDSQLATFYLDKINNCFEINVLGTNQDFQLVFSYTDRYIGI